MSEIIIIAIIGACMVLIAIANVFTVGCTLYGFYLMGQAKALRADAAHYRGLYTHYSDRANGLEAQLDKLGVGQ